LTVSLRREARLAPPFPARKLVESICSGSGAGAGRSASLPEGGACRKSIPGNAGSQAGIARSRRLHKEQGGFAAAANPKDMSLEHIEIKREEI
jgi:hypothetical protein